MLRRYLDLPTIEVPLTRGKYYYQNSFLYLKSTGKRIEPIFDSNGIGWIYIDFGYGTVKFKYSVVIAYSTKNCSFPIRHIVDLDVLHVDGDYKNFFPGNLVLKFPKGGLSVSARSEFRYIPGFSKYLINKKGEVFSIHVNRLISSYTDKMGYTMFGMQPDIGKRTIIGQHRLLALTFLDYDENVDSLDVNHIDGVKSNNDLSNLEWASRQLNCIHAYSTGLRTDNCEIDVRDVRTGKVFKYYSYSHCANDLNLTHATIIFRVRNKDQKVYFPGLQFKLSSDKSDWRIAGDQVSECLKSGQAVPIVVKDSQTGLLTEYDSVTDFSKASGYSAYQIRNKITDLNTQASLGKYLLWVNLNKYKSPSS